jgi:putative FmdB family regulatory protein
MPIYAYKCDACGFAKDVLQKMSDAPLQDCPSCGKSTFSKQVTAAGFQLKGSGWYVTDFRGGNSAASAAAPATEAAASTGEPAKAESPKAEAPKSEANKADAPKAAAAPSGTSSGTPTANS